MRQENKKLDDQVTQLRQTDGSAVSPASHRQLLSECEQLRAESAQLEDEMDEKHEL